MTNDNRRQMKDSLQRLSPEFQELLLTHGYSIYTNAHPAKIMEDISGGKKSADGRVTISDQNHERAFFECLAKFLYAKHQDKKYPLQFEEDAMCFLGIESVDIDTEDSSDKGFDAQLINLKEFLIATRVPWRDVTVENIIAAFEDEPNRTLRIRANLQRIHKKYPDIAKARQLPKLINSVSKESWRPLINRQSQSNYKKLCNLKYNLDRSRFVERPSRLSPMICIVFLIFFAAMVLVSPFIQKYFINLVE